MSYPHEWNQSERQRFDNACDAADLTPAEKDRFSDYLHQQPDRQRMSYSDLVEMAKEWKRENGGGFRRSDRR
jgi:hypothetical protein